MVNLPKPSAFASRSDIDILPRSKLASQLPPLPSSTPPCCYRFGLTSLPQEAQTSSHGDLDEILNRLLAVSQLLAVPSLFGKGDGQAWMHSEQHYPALLRWKEQQLPALLAQLSPLLQQLHDVGISGVSEAGFDTVQLVLGHVVCAVARYLLPPPVFIDAGSSIPTATPPQDDWTSVAASTTAQSILSGLRQRCPSEPLFQPSNLAQALLSDYIKPIIRETGSSSSASTSSINPSTGRANPPAAGSHLISHLDAHLGQHRFQSADQDGDASNLAPSKFDFLLPLETQQTGESFGVERNEALGCINVLAWCLDNLRLDGESEWMEVWPLIVPALLTLLEHPQPRFRVKGSLLVHRLLLRPSMDSGCPSVLGKILIRTGIGSLLERALHVNLTYIHDADFAPPLLYHSIGALRQLILLTTDPIAYRHPTQSEALPTNFTHTGVSKGESNDCGKRRMEALFRLVSEAVLSTWSYLPLPPSSTRLGRELVDVTCSAYLILADDLSPPPIGESRSIGATARFLDVTIDWIFRSWLSTVAFDHTDQLDITVKVLRLADRLLFPGLIEGSSHKLGVDPSRRFLGLILSSVAKCHISALESHMRSQSDSSAEAAGDDWERLQQSLSTLLNKLADSNPSVESRWAELVKLDRRLKVLLTSQEAI